MESRNFGLAARRSFNKPQILEGYAALFNSRTNIGKFDEEILPGAFRESIKKDDIRCLLNHDENHILGRSRAGTLSLFEDHKGLAVRINLPDTQFARDLAVSIVRGDINQMSFAFKVLEEEWIAGGKSKPDLRRLKKLKLFDVSVVTFPAYENTDVALASSSRTWLNNIISPFMAMAVMNEARSKYSDIDSLIRG